MVHKAIVYFVAALCIKSLHSRSHKIIWKRRNTAKDELDYATILRKQYLNLAETKFSGFGIGDFPY